MSDHLHPDPLLLHRLLHVHAARVAAHVLSRRLRGQKGEPNEQDKDLTWGGGDMASLDTLESKLIF